MTITDLPPAPAPLTYTERSDIWHDVYMGRHPDPALLERLTPWPGINEALVREVLTHIRLHPEAWDQSRWVGACGTVACFAGWTVALRHGLEDNLGHLTYLPTSYRNSIAGLAVEAIGMPSEPLYSLVFGFAAVYDDNGRFPGFVRKPTFAELCDRVWFVTGIRFKPDEIDA